MAQGLNMWRRWCLRACLSGIYSIAMANRSNTGKAKHARLHDYCSTTFVKSFELEQEHGSTVVWGLTGYVTSVVLRKAIVPLLEQSRTPGANE